MILSDTMIREYLAAGHLAIEPLDDERQIQPASVDLRLAHELGIYHNDARRQLVDPANKEALRYLTASHFMTDEGFRLEPGQFLLARTLETVRVPGAPLIREYWVDDPRWNPFHAGRRPQMAVRDDLPPLVGRVEGRSSLGRLGVFCHVTAGYIDPGFAGTITLELYNAGPLSVLLRPGMRFCQLSLLTCGPVARPYGSQELGSKYQGQVATTASRGL